MQGTSGRAASRVPDASSVNHGRAGSAERRAGTSGPCSSTASTLPASSAASACKGPRPGTGTASSPIMPRAQSAAAPGASGAGEREADGAGGGQVGAASHDRQAFRGADRKPAAGLEPRARVADQPRQGGAAAQHQQGAAVGLHLGGEAVGGGDAVRAAEHGAGHVHRGGRAAPEKGGEAGRPALVGAVLRPRHQEGGDARQQRAGVRRGQRAKGGESGGAAEQRATPAGRWLARRGSALRCRRGVITRTAAAFRRAGRGGRGRGGRSARSAPPPPAPRRPRSRSKRTPAAMVPPVASRSSSSTTR